MTTRGLGLLGPSERTAAVGGELQVHSAPVSGVTLMLRIPLLEAMPLVVAPLSPLSNEAALREAA